MRFATITRKTHRAVFAKSKEAWQSRATAKTLVTNALLRHMLKMLLWACPQKNEASRLEAFARKTMVLYGVHLSDLGGLPSSDENIFLAKVVTTRVTSVHCAPEVYTGQQTAKTGLSIGAIAQTNHGTGQQNTAFYHALMSSLKKNTDIFSVDKHEPLE